MLLRHCGELAVVRQMIADDERRSRIKAQVRETAFGFVVCVSVEGGEVVATADPVSPAVPQMASASCFLYEALTETDVRVTVVDDQTGMPEEVLVLSPGVPQAIASPVAAYDGQSARQEICLFCLFVGDGAEARAAAWQEQTVASQQAKITKNDTEGG